MKRNGWRTTSSGNKRTKFDYVAVRIIPLFNFFKKLQPAVKCAELSDYNKIYPNAWVLKKEIPCSHWSNLYISVKD